MHTARRLTLLLLAAAVVCALSSPAPAKPEPVHTRLRENLDKTVYRIPALAVSNKDIRGFK